MNSGNKFLFVLFSIITVTGVAIYMESSVYQKRSKVAQGTVVNLMRSHLEIKYISDDRVERTYRGPKEKLNLKHSYGKSVKVFYRIDNPDRSRIFDGKKVGKKIIFWGFIVLLFNLVLIYSARKKAKTANSLRTTERKDQIM